MKREWKAHPRQEQAVTTPDSIMEVFYGGAAGGGKTDCGVAIPIVKQTRSGMQLYQHPNFKGLIMRRTIPELKKELVDRCREYYNHTGCKYNKTDRVFEWDWGAKLYLGAAEHEEDVRRYDTEQFSYLFMEELTSFTEFQYVFMISRLRPADPDLPSLIFSASNPGNIGHGWVRKRFVEPYREGGKILRQYIFNKDGSYKLNPDGTRKSTLRIYIRALGSDNPYLLKNDPDYLTKLELLPEAEKAAKLYGDWWTFSGQVFDTFRSKKYPDEPDNALHVIPPFEIPSWWPRILAIDWGYKAATVAYWGAVSPEGKCYIYRGYYVRETEVAVWGTEIGDLSRGENIKCIALDTNAWDSRGEEKSIAVQFQEKFNAAIGHNQLVAEPASKGRISGKTLIQEYLRWMPKPIVEKQEIKAFDPEEALRLKRFNETAYQHYLELFDPPKTETNIPRLLIFDTESTKQLVECIPLCVYDEDDVEDVKEWQASTDSVGDDPYDCLRYLIKRVDKYVHESKKEFDHRAKEQAIVEHFHTTQDTTGYYRRMEKFESTNSHLRKRSIRRAGLAQRLFRKRM